MMNPRVREVIANHDFSLFLTFTNGEQGTFDCKPLLDFGVFRELQDLRYFCRATVVHGTVVWPHEQDICPDTLYLDSLKTAISPSKLSNNCT